MQKNTAGKWIVFAFNRTDNVPQTGDALNITANIRIDGGAANPVDDTNPTELEDGYYVFDITAAEANGDNIVICPASTTANIQVIGVPGAVWTEQVTAKLPTNYIMGSSVQTAKDDEIDAILVDTADMQPKLGTPAGASISADILTIDNFVDDLETRLTAARAGYLDNLSAGAVALASVCTNTRLAELDAANIPADVDTVLTRLSATRAGYLDNLSVGAVALEATLTTMKQKVAGTFDRETDSLEALRDRGDAAWITATGFATAAVCTEARLAELDAANLITDVANVKTDTAAILVDTADMQPKLGSPAASVSADIAAVKVDSAAIKVKTDSLPSGIEKNIALSNFQFYMVLTSDHVTAATGKTVTGTISKDGGAFAGLTNAISEIGNGMYKVNLTQTEMNADVITLKFTETNCDQRIITVYTS